MKRQLLISAVVPVVSAAVILLAGVLLGWMTRSRRPETWGGSLAFGLPFFLTFCLINGSIPEFPPGTTVNWIPFVGLLTAGLGIVEVEGTVPACLRWGIRVLLAGFALVVTLSPMQSFFSTGVLVVGTIGVLVTLMTAWWLVEQCVEADLEYVIPLAYLICSTVASVVLLTVFSYASMAQVSGAFAALCGTMLVYCFWRPSRTVLNGLLPGMMILFPLFLLSGWHFGTGEHRLTWPVLLLLLVPAGIWAAYLPGIVSRIGESGRLQRGGVCALSVLLLSGVVVLAVWFGQAGTGNSGSPYDQDQEKEEYDDYGY